MDMRPLRLALLLIVAFAARRAHAQAVGGIRGRVVDQSGRAVENADVELLPGSLHTVTLDDGRFTIPNVRVGVYVLSARRIGYEPTDVNVAVGGDSTVTFTITLAAISTQLDAIHIREKAGEIQYSGVVLDQFDVPVAEAEVVAVGINSQLKTDGMGRFIVPKLGKGTLAVRIRKVGYSAYFGSFRILTERADTIRMSRLAASLTPVEINELSGFGRDYWAYREMQQRQTWKNAMNGSISREELAQRGTETLCDALPGTPSGAKLSMPMDPWCKILPRGEKTILIDGVRCVHGLLSDYAASDVEFVEYYSVTTKIVGSKPLGTLAKQRGPLLAADDMSGSLRAHMCDAPPPVYVIWLRHDAPKTTPTRTVALDPNPAVDSAIPRMPPIEVRAVPLINAAHLQGQVVDSTNHPLRSALVYTEDPLFATLTDKNGYFKFRELPSGPITIRAERRGFVPIEFQLRLPADSTVGIGLKLLRAAPAIGTMALDTTGAQGRIVRVVSDRGPPVMYANVTLEGAQARITDEKGEINLGSGPRQKFSVRVARIGFAPWFGVVDLPSNATMTVTLPQIAQLLAPVTVSSNGSKTTTTSLPLAGFYDRWMMRQKGTVTGVFIGPEELEFRHPSKVSRMLAGMNGIRLICDMSGDCSMQSTNPGGILPGTACPLAIVLDGTQIYGQVNVDALINVNDVMAIEVYARGGNVPISLQVNDTKCGVVAFWTGSRK
jgi:hypothetical protein